MFTEKAATGMRHGRVRQGVEYIMPSAIANVSKAERLYREGEYTLKGRRVMDDKAQKGASRISAGRAALQALGFSNVDAAKRWDRQGLADAAAERKKDVRDELVERFTDAVEKKDMKARAKVVAEWKEWNKKHPDDRMAPLPQIMRARMKPVVRQ